MVDAFFMFIFIISTNNYFMWKDAPEQKDYYAVIFSSAKSDDLDGYAEMDELTMKLAQEQKGFLGYESCANSEIIKG